MAGARRIGLEAVEIVVTHPFHVENMSPLSPLAQVSSLFDATMNSKRSGDAKSINVSEKDAW